MPEMTFTVEWPDGSFQECYSPSLVMHDHLREGESYSVGDFMRRVAAALNEASRRVREKYGFACTSAAAQLADIESRSRQFVRTNTVASAPSETTPVVRVVAMEPPLPTNPRS